jgi:uncharacterized protein (TIGR02466 family)
MRIRQEVQALPRRTGLNVADQSARQISETAPPRIFSSPAFASYIDGYQVPDAEALNARLVADVLAWRDAEGGEGIASSNHLGWHSSRDLFDRPEASFRDLIAQIAAATTASIRRYWPEFNPTRHGTVWEGWANINGPGAVNKPHSHSQHLSGVYYVKVPEAAKTPDGMIEFLHPAGAVRRASEFDYRLIRTTQQIKPKAGQMFIFPSYLNHWVYPHYEEADRISIAFNVAVLGGAAGT